MIFLENNLQEVNFDMHFMKLFLVNFHLKSELNLSSNLMNGLSRIQKTKKLCFVDDLKNYELNEKLC